MSNISKDRQVRRGRIFPEIQWTEEQKAEWRQKQSEFYQRCLPIFERLKAGLMETNYGWYMAVEPESQDYFLAEDELKVIGMARQEHPNHLVFIFRITETGLAGTI